MTGLPSVVGPIGPWALAGLVGALLGSGGPWRVSLLLVVVACTIVAVATTMAAPSRCRGARLVAGGLVVALALALGGQVRTSLIEQGPATAWADRGGTLDARVVVVTEPRASEHGWWAVARIERLGEVGARQRVLLRGTDDLPALWSRWSGPASARRIDHERPFERYLATLHVALVLTPEGPGRWDPAGMLGTTTEWLRARVRTAAGGPSGDAAALVVGLATGDTRGLTPAAREHLLEAGLSHLTAVSGSNVALVVAAAMGLVLLLPVGPLGGQAILLVAVGWFAVLTRFEPSVLRACAMVGVLAAARARSTIGEPRHALASAVLLLLVVDPMLSRSLGLLLSAAAAAGILLLVPRLTERLRRLPGWLRVPLAVTLAAQIGVAPVLLAAESDVGLADIPANLVAVPLAMVASALAGVGSLAALLAPWLGAPLFAVATVPGAAILAVARTFASSGPTLSTVRPLSLLLATAVLLGWLARPSGRARLAAGAVAMVLLVAVALPPSLPSVSGLVVTAIDVGQGDAILVQSQDGTTILVDAGGDDRAAKWLRRRGVDHLDLLVVTHPHLDHVGGAPAVLRSVTVAALWNRPVPTELPEAEEVRRMATARRVPVEHPVTGQRLQLRQTSIEVVGPSAGRPFEFSSSEPNDTSLVLRISHRGRSVLLTGDAELAAQQQMLARPSRLRAGLLKVPHHGGATSLPAFLAAVGARTAIVSVGRGNRYGHPSPEVIDQLEAGGARVLRTDLLGTIRVEAPATEPPGGHGQPEDVAAVGSTHLASWSTRHGRSGHPRHGRRRSPAPARVRGRVGPAPGGSSGCRSRHPPRRRARPPPGPAHVIAVRWYDDRRHPRP